jgi:hypothetical protein
VRISVKKDVHHLSIRCELFIPFKAIFCHINVGDVYHVFFEIIFLNLNPPREPLYVENDSEMVKSTKTNLSVCYGFSL